MAQQAPCSWRRLRGWVPRWFSDVPLTLFVMTLAVSRGVPEAGLVFAVAMFPGVAAVLDTLAGLALIAIALHGLSRQASTILPERSILPSVA